MDKSIYIDLMEKVLEAYTIEQIKSYTDSVATDGIKEHGFPRLTANIGILLANGIKTQYKDQFKKMMDLCCNGMATALELNGEKVANDFSVREIVSCLIEVENSGIFDKQTTDNWKKELAKINPYKAYTVVASSAFDKVNNFAAYSAASEQLRKYAGIGNNDEFIETHIATQLLSFDSKGMYRDPNEPMLYDFVTRLQLAVSLYYGYNGENRDALEQMLLKSADITLNMQSVTGEMPYGGRSNQFLFNEAAFAALCEFYAVLFKKRGSIKKAGKFKSAAALAVQSIIPWLKEEKISHVKNHFPADMRFGCERYAYFDKYMITTSSMLYLAYTMADESIAEIDCPAISKNTVCRTGRYFHKVMLRYKDYFAQFDTKADAHYDASGLGRLHKKGAPSALCMSVPFSKHPNYSLDLENPSPFSICAGVDGDYTYDAKYKLVKKAITDKYAFVEFECKTKSGAVIKKQCTLSDDGFKMEVSADGEIEILFPLFKFDGLLKTEISVDRNKAEVTYKGFKCTYKTDGAIADKNTIYANRNGHYKGMCAKAKDKLTIYIEIKECI